MITDLSQMTPLFLLLWTILLFPSFILSADSLDNFADLNRTGGFYECGASRITTSLDYCTPFRTCDRAGIIRNKADLPAVYSEGADAYSFAICDRAIDKMKVQVRIHKSPDIWKNVETIFCKQKDGNKEVNAKFTGKGLFYNEQIVRSEIALRCVSEGKARFDIYHTREDKDGDEGVYKKERLYVVFTFVALLITLTVMTIYYLLFLHWENQKLMRAVIRRQSRHDELWLSIERSERMEYDPEEVWNAMPLIHQQVAIEAAIFIQRYKGEKYTPQLRQWLIDRNYPAGATEIILYLAGLNDPECPFYAPEERTSEFKNEDKLENFTQKIESRIVDTLNYANRLRRRKIVFTDHRWLELHHFFIELGLTSLGSPSHPTIHDADIPVLPRHAFGTRDDPRDEEKEQRDSEIRNRKPHFLHYDWDEAEKLLG